MFFFLNNSNSSNLSLFTSDVPKHVVPLPSIWIVCFVPFDCWVGFGWVWFVLGLFGCLDWLGSTKQKNPNRIFNLYSCVLGWNMDKRYKIHKLMPKIFILVMFFFSHFDSYFSS